MLAAERQLDFAGRRCRLSLLNQEAEGMYDYLTGKEQQATHHMQALGVRREADMLAVDVEACAAASTGRERKMGEVERQRRWFHEATERVGACVAAIFDPLVEDGATALQRIHRGRSARRRVARVGWMRRMVRGATACQQRQRGKLAIRAAKKRRLALVNIAGLTLIIRMQRAWRRWAVHRDRSAAARGEGGGGGEVADEFDAGRGVGGGGGGEGGGDPAAAAEAERRLVAARREDAAIKSELAKSARTRRVAFKEKKAQLAAVVRMQRCFRYILHNQRTTSKVARTMVNLATQQAQGKLSAIMVPLARKYAREKARAKAACFAGKSGLHPSLKATEWWTSPRHKHDIKLLVQQLRRMPAFAPGDGLDFLNKAVVRHGGILADIEAADEHGMGADQGRSAALDAARQEEEKAARVEQNKMEAAMFGARHQGATALKGKLGKSAGIVMSVYKDQQLLIIRCFGGCCWRLEGDKACVRNKLFPTQRGLWHFIAAVDALLWAPDLAREKEEEKAMARDFVLASMGDRRFAMQSRQRSAAKEAEAEERRQREVQARLMASMAEGGGRADEWPPTDGAQTRAHAYQGRDEDKDALADTKEEAELAGGKRLRDIAAEKKYYFTWIRDGERCNVCHHVAPAAPGGGCSWCHAPPMYQRPLSSAAAPMKTSPLVLSTVADIRSPLHPFLAHAMWRVMAPVHSKERDLKPESTYNEAVGLCKAWVERLQQALGATTVAHLCEHVGKHMHFGPPPRVGHDGGEHDDQEEEDDHAYEERVAHMDASSSSSDDDTSGPAAAAARLRERVAAAVLKRFVAAATELLEGQCRLHEGAGEAVGRLLYFVDCEAAAVHRRLQAAIAAGKATTGDVATSDGLAGPVGVGEGLQGRVRRERRAAKELEARERELGVWGRGGGRKQKSAQALPRTAQRRAQTAPAGQQAPRRRRRCGGALKRPSKGYQPGLAQPQQHGGLDAGLPPVSGARRSFGRGLAQTAAAGRPVLAPLAAEAEGEEGGGGGGSGAGVASQRRRPMTEGGQRLGRAPRMDTGGEGEKHKHHRNSFSHEGGFATFVTKARSAEARRKKKSMHLPPSRLFAPPRRDLVNSTKQFVKDWAWVQEQAARLEPRLSQHATRLLRFNVGDYILRPGDAAQRASCFFIKSGVLEVLVGTGASERVVAKMVAPQFFGERSILTGEPRSAAIRVGGADEGEDDRAEVLMLAPAPFKALFAQDSGFRRTIQVVSSKYVFAKTLDAAEFDWEKVMSYIKKKGETARFDKGATIIREGDLPEVRLPAAQGRRRRRRAAAAAVAAAASLAARSCHAAPCRPLTFPVPGTPPTRAARLGLHVLSDHGAGGGAREERGHGGRAGAASLLRRARHVRCAREALGNDPRAHRSVRLRAVAQQLRQLHGRRRGLQDEAEEGALRRCQAEGARARAQAQAGRRGGAGRRGALRLPRVLVAGAAREGAGDSGGAARDLPPAEGGGGEAEGGGGEGRARAPPAGAAPCATRQQEAPNARQQRRRRRGGSGRGGGAGADCTGRGSAAEEGVAPRPGARDIYRAPRTAPLRVRKLRHRGQAKAARLGPRPLSVQQRYCTMKINARLT
jgi:hypothetical protein